LHPVACVRDRGESVLFFPVYATLIS
jgi:hypothetical protein